MEECSYNSDSCSTESTTQQEGPSPPSKRREVPVWFFSRFAIVAVLSVVTAAVGAVVYKLASNDEHDDLLVHVSVNHVELLLRDEGVSTAFLKFLFRLIVS
jgi:hypothetical protein